VHKKKCEMLENKESVPLNVAIVRTINKLVSSKQRYKVLSNSNLAANIEKSVFDPTLCNAVALEKVISESRKWLRKNVFQCAEIL